MVCPKYSRFFKMFPMVDDTHQAIIDQQTCDLAQKIRSNVRRYPNGWGEAAPLTGLLYCADCGGKMYVHRTNNGKRISQYTCCLLYTSDIMAFFVLEMLSGLEIDGVSQIFTLFKNVADGGRTPAVHLSLIHI